MGKLQRYLWPKTLLLFYLRGDEIVAAFGFVEKGGCQIVERRTFPLAKRADLLAWHEEIRYTYPRTYVAAMLDTLNQGALPGCGQRIYERFGIDAALVQALCIEKIWTVYTALVEMKWFEQKFKGMTLDLLYSPFALLFHTVKKELDERPTLYLLHEKGRVYLMVLQEGRVWYANILTVASEAAPVQEELEGDEEDELSFDLEMLDDEEEGVVPIAGMEGLEDLSGSEDEGSGGDEEALRKLEYTLTLFDEIKEAIGRYYRDERYDQTFIERIVMLDTEGLGDDFVRYVEDELFMEATIRRFEPMEPMAAMAVAEVG